tara:strand:- start:1061 stop:1261 length:201 start_codon:yes stop_codon:yes gene_type:complete
MSYHETRKHTKMPFGKFKGVYIKDIPDQYIKWLVMNLKDKATTYYFSEELLYRDKKLKRQLSKSST